MFKFHPPFFVILLYSVLVRADYTIDDSNYSVLEFSENPAGPVWGPFGSDSGEVLEIQLPNGTMQAIDATQCYDGTYTYAACTTADNCAVQFSFTGSGLTIYVLQAGPQGISASLSIDSGTATVATLGAPSPPQYYDPRATLFDVQNIPSGAHTAVMTVLDWNGGLSSMMLDYINVNQAEIASPTTGSSSSPSPTPTPSSDPTQSSSALLPTSASSQVDVQQTSGAGTQTGTVVSPAIVVSVFSSYSSGAITLPSNTAFGSSTGSPNSLSSTSKKTNVAIVAGGAAGGAVGLLVFLGLAFYCIRRCRRQHMQALYERPSPLLLPPPEVRLTTTYPAAIVDPFSPPSVVRLSGMAHPLQTWASSEAGSTPNIVARGLGRSSPIMSLSHTRVASSGDISATSSVPVSIGTVGAVSSIYPDRDTPTPTQLHSPVRPAAVAAPISYLTDKSRRSLGTPARWLPQDARASLDVAAPRPKVALTDEQADFVNCLFNNNVPAPVVARVLERMLANPQGASSIGVNDPELRTHADAGSLFPSPQNPAGSAAWLPMAGDSRDGETIVGTAPPSYDYARGQR